MGPEPGGIVELRVHGVAGTPPEEMLQLVPAEQVRGPAPAPAGADDRITEWTQPPHRPTLRAWSWGSLTSGRWYQAFYLVLTPFMLANLAGWMLLTGPADDGRPRSPRTRCCVLLVRLAGLLVTVIFVLWTQLVVADLAAYQWLVRGLGAPSWTVGIGTVATAALLVAVVWLSRIRPRGEVRAGDPWAVWTDPAGVAALRHDQHPMWNSPGINVGLRRLHLAAALAAVAVVAGWPGTADAEPWAGLGRVGFWVGVGGLVLVVGLVVWLSLAGGAPEGGFPDRTTCACAGGAAHSSPLRGRGLPPAALVRHGSWPASAAAVGLTASSTAGLGPGWLAAHPFLPALRGSALWLSAAVLVVVLAVAAIGRDGRSAPAGLRRSPGLRRANAGGTLLLSASLGAALGAGVAEQVARLVGDGGCEQVAPPCLVVGDHVGWMAIAYVTILAMFLLTTALAWAVLRFVPRAGGGPMSSAVALRTLTRGGSWAIALLGGLGIAVCGYGIGVALVDGGLPPVSTVPSPVAAAVVCTLGVVALVGLVVAVRHVRPSRAVTAALAVAVTGVVVLLVVAVRRGWSVQVLGIPVPPRTFAEFTLALAIVAPTLLVLRRMYAAVTSTTVRRGVGVLWDVGTFWPRWFHPFAPPTYSDRAVTGLVTRIEQDGGPLLVAAHSQGSIIAGTALLDADVSPRVALLTFGSPWRHLYGEFFPGYFGPAATEALADRLPARWRNLFRDTDPIGGPVERAAVDAAVIPDVHDRVHSGYWLEDAYRDAVRRLARVIRGGPREHRPEPDG